MKSFKFLALFSIAGMLLGGFPVFAQTATVAPSSSQALIQSLQNQISVLQAQLDALRKAQSQVVGTVNDIQGTLRLINQLREGSSGEEVRLLQAILASNPEIYPEGLISGFYGKLTSKAIKRFQKLYGLDQVGRVGKKTLEKLNDELRKNPLIKEVGEGHEDRICAIVPPGHLIAPGWLRKHDGVRSIVPQCQKLPPGIKELLEGKKATTTPPIVDVTPPTLSNLAVSVTNTSVLVMWRTDEKSTSKVWYSTISPVVATSTTPMVSSASFMREHALVISGLLSGTTYYYVVESVDMSGNKSVSAQQSFITLQTPDVSVPLISGVTATSTNATTTRIIWNTNEVANSKVWYSTSTSVMATGTTPVVSDSSFVTSHNMALVGLVASTTYYYRVESADGVGNVSVSDQQSFVTQQPSDVTPPTISGIVATSTMATSTRIVWSTNEVATSKVSYSTSSPVVVSTASTVSDAAFLLNHDITLQNLMASSTYYYVAISSDVAGNSATSAEASFVTLGQ
ncbi:MAG: fibronectin type III domain-containing protein [Parcubacteria group bacterium]|nr:fibronectin type III domain-containing protein [Parcubacteria group bacterium]